MKIWFISDTHCFHNELLVPHDVEMVIHAGDFTETKNNIDNLKEASQFIDWMEALDIKHKVVVPGNHDTSVGPYNLQTDFKKAGIALLMNAALYVEGLNIWGSPFTPSYGQGWAFNMARHKIDRVWQTIPNNVDIMVTHGPPQGVLDLTRGLDHKLKRVGCKALLNNVKRVQPRVHVFGHCHDEKDIDNRGMLYRDGTTFVNASCCKNGTKVLNQGFVYEVEKRGVWNETNSTGTPQKSSEVVTKRSPSRPSECRPSVAGFKAKLDRSDSRFVQFGDG